jgi:hypothetical protein
MNAMKAILAAALAACSLAACSSAPTADFPATPQCSYPGAGVQCRGLYPG